MARDEWDRTAPIKVNTVEEVFQRFSGIAGLHAGGQYFRTTLEHPFIERFNGWTACSNLRPGDQIYTEDRWITVEEVHDTGDWEVVYNVRVSDHHTYFVGEEDWGWSLWAHNAYTLTAAMEQKILYGEIKQGTVRNLIGAHSGNILLNATGQFEIQILVHNADGTTSVKFVKDIGGNVINVKKSTLAPTTWSDAKIIDVTRIVSDMPVALRSLDGRVWKHGTIEGVNWEVIVNASGEIISSYPTGGGWSTKL